MVFELMSLLVLQIFNIFVQWRFEFGLYRVVFYKQVNVVFVLGVLFFYLYVKLVIMYVVDDDMVCVVKEFLVVWDVDLDEELFIVDVFNVGQ